VRDFIRFFARRHTLANVFTAGVILLGLSALTVIQRDNFPSVDFEEMTITTRYPGASPQDVELNVTNKIEEELKEVDGIEKFTSFSMENISIVHVRLDPDAKDKKKAKTDVRDAVSRATELPPEVDEAPLVEELTTATGIPVIEIGITGRANYGTLREIARAAEKELLNLPGVASLTKYGYLDREIKIEVGQNALERYEISTREIAEAIHNRNIRATGGSFESYTSERNIVTLAQFTDPLEVGDVIIRSTADGAVLRVQDVAVVRDDFEPAKVRSRMNGSPAVSFLVFKKESADIIRTVDAIKQWVEENRHRLPEGVSIEYSNDQSRIVRNRLQVVVSNGVLGLVLVVVTLSVFLDLRAALWVALGIPVALLGTLFLLPLFGAYLDSIALGAMIIVIGIIVDDGIIVAENIWRYREQGVAPVEAAVEGVSSVFHPVLTTIVTTALAFMPMFFMSGTLGSFIYIIPLVVVLALIISFGEVVLALPAHLIGKNSQGWAKARTTHWAHLFERFRAAVRRLIGHFLHWRYAVLGVFGLLLIMAFWYAGRYLDFVLFPTQSADAFYILIELPSGSSLDRTEEKVKEIEALVDGLPEGELDSFITRVGSHGEFNLGENENWAFVGIYLTPYATRSRNADEILEELRTKTSRLQGMDGIRFVVESGGPPVGRPITLRVVGSDDQLRTDLASLLVERLNAMDGVTDVDRDDKRGKEQIEVALDYIRLASMGLSVADVARTIRMAYDGEIVTSVRYGDEDVDFRVILEKQVRASPEGLGEIVVRNREGRFVQLGEVAALRPEAGPSNIYHFNNERAITLTSDVVKGKTTPLEAVEQALSGLDFDDDWPGMQVVMGGEAEETADSMRSLIGAFLAAAVAIYLVLLLLFNSMVQPVLVMLAIPFALIGVIAAFALHHQALGFLAMLGVVGLTGIVVNDSLILVNMVNQLQLEQPHTPLRTLLLEAVEQRLRPILLTSMTTAAGLLPMAYGLGGSDPFSAPMALAMGYGILFATPLTLVLLPCLLAVQEDVAKASRRLSGALLPLMQGRWPRGHVERTDGNNEL
jgi:multidrug efflux pump subunit AcrB